MIGELHKKCLLHFLLYLQYESFLHIAQLAIIHFYWRKTRNWNCMLRNKNDQTRSTKVQKDSMGRHWNSRATALACHKFHFFLHAFHVPQTNLFSLGRIEKSKVDLMVFPSLEGSSYFTTRRLQQQFGGSSKQNVQGRVYDLTALEPGAHFSSREHLKNTPKGLRDEPAARPNKVLANRAFFLRLWKRRTASLEFLQQHCAGSSGRLLQTTLAISRLYSDQTIKV